MAGPFRGIYHFCSTTCNCLTARVRRIEADSAQRVLDAKRVSDAGQRVRDDGLRAVYAAELREGRAILDEHYARARAERDASR